MGEQIIEVVETISEPFVDAAEDALGLPEDSLDVDETDVGPTVIGAGEILTDNAENLFDSSTNIIDAQTSSGAANITFNPYTPQLASLPIIYGTRRTEGSLVLQETNANPGKYLYRFYALSDGECGSVTVTTEPASASSSDNVSSGIYKTKTFLGADAGMQASLPSGDSWVNDPPSWGTDFAFKGVCAAMFRFEYNKTDMARAPKVFFTVSGRTLTGNDDNPANIAKDYLTNTRYGAGISSSLIDTTSFDAVRDYCDETDSGGNKRFTCNVILSPQNRVIDNVKIILTSFLGQLHYVQGKYYLHADKEFSGTPVVAYDTTKIIGGLSVQNASKNSRFNQCIATFFDPDQDYKATEVTWPDPNNESSTLSTYLTEDNNLPLIKRINLPGVTNFQQARYIASIVVRQSRSSIMVSMNTTAESGNVIPGDIVTLTWSPLSYTNKEFRVREVSINPNGGMKIKAIEHNDANYTRSIGTAHATPTTITVRDPSVISAVTGLTATETLYFTREGAGVKSKVTLNWNDISDNFLAAYEVSFKLSSASEFEVVGDTLETTIEVLDIGVGAFDFRVVSRAIEGAKSTASTVSLTTTGLDAVPSPVTGLFANSLGTMALVQWDLSTDLDVIQGGYYSIKHSVDSAASSWSQGVPLINNVAGHQTSAIVPLLAGTYMIRAHDSSGQASLATFVQSSGISLTPLETDAQITEETSFSGTKNKVEAIDDILKIVSEDQIDSISNFDNIERFDALGGIYNTSSAGYSTNKPQYDFANTMDLGSVKTVRLRSFIKTISESIIDLIDSRPGNVDSYTDWDDTEFDKTSIRIQVRSTNDNPSGSPSYGEFTDFYAEERSARAHQFRIFPETTDSEYNIKVQNLQIFAETLAS
tara:strand:- start:3096 stop:5720 length:2625 start_codon:yes stop_codon:yes gene_type:complete